MAAKAKKKTTDANGQAEAKAKAKAKASQAKGSKGKKKAPARRRAKGVAEPGTRGLAAAALAGREPPADVRALAEKLEADGGAVLAVFRDPLGGHWQVLGSIPIEAIAPTPFQRDLSETHAKRLAEVIDRLDWFIDPIVAVPAPHGGYWTPNGYHRLEGMRRLGARSIVILLLPRTEVAYQILALNTEKAHNVKEKSLEVVRMARFLAELEARGEPAMKERDFAHELEEPSYLTLGLCYEQRGRFSGGAYQSLLKRVEGWVEGSITEALAVRAGRAARLLALDDAVAEVVARLKERGFESPYLKAFVIARVNPLRFKRGATAELDSTFDAMMDALARFDVGKVRSDQVAAAAGPPEG